jgi:hypothetical protein
MLSMIIEQIIESMLSMRLRFISHAHHALKIIKKMLSMRLKVHKIEKFFGFDFEICIISLLVISKY